MTTFREKYDFWTDRQVGDYIYRFNSFDIQRCRAGDKSRHFKVWEDYETQVECHRAWQKLCNLAAAKQTVPQASRLPSKETA